MQNKQALVITIVTHAFKGMNVLLENMILFLCLITFGFSCYAVWDSETLYTEAENGQYIVYKPSVDTTYSFEELCHINPEVIGWLELFGTNIDYPITQALDNEKYVKTDVMGTYSLSGSIFLDYQNHKQFSDFNHILYGHHMEKHQMFGGIDLFEDQTYFMEHPYGSLFYDGKDHGLELIAMLKTNAYDQRIYQPSIIGQQQKEAFLAMLQQEAVHVRGKNLSIENRFLVLSTCSSQSTDGRSLLVYRIHEVAFENPFDKDENK